MPERRVLAIFGPTASGKTDVAVALTRLISAELISADAMQVYRGLPILTNQSPHDPTHLVAIWPLQHEGSVGEYAELAHAAVDDVLARGRTPVVVGGTGLYLRAALADLAIPPGPTPGLREHVDALYERLGPEGAHEALAERDPAAAAAVHANDRRRVVRALELSELGWSLRPPEHRLWTEQTRHPTAIVGLELPSDELDRRIEERAHAMFEAGVVDEVREATRQGISRTAWSVHGLRPIAELPPAAALAETIRATRRYARYQRRWMRRIPGLLLFDANRPAAEVAAEILARTAAR